MSEVISALGLVFFGCLAVMIAAILIDAIREGPQEIRRLRQSLHPLRKDEI